MMGNALLFTGLLLGAAVLGGFIGSCCGSKRREDGCGHEARIAELEERLDALADHSMEEEHKIRERVDELEFLIGETPTGGLLGRVGALEDARKKIVEVVEATRQKHNELADAYETTASHAKSALAIGDALMDGYKELRDKVEALEKRVDGLQMVNDAEHHALLEHQKCIVKDIKEAQGGQQ